MSRPSIESPCVADRYVSEPKAERIAEFNSNDGSGAGGLLSLTCGATSRYPQGGLRVELYRLSAGVEVIVDALALAPQVVAEVIRRYNSGKQKKQTDDCTALDAIRVLMDGTEWDADTMDAVARLVRQTGRTIREVE